MYAVVGCNECSALWILGDGQETAGCPRCGKRHRVKKLKRFVETDDEDHAREVRASMLANRQGEGEAFAAVDSFAALESDTERPIVDDEEYLAGSGIDPDEVAAAGSRSTASPSSSGSRRDVVLSGLSELEEPTADEISEYAAERGVPPEYVESALEKLVRSGAVSERRGRYRLL